MGKKRKWVPEVLWRLYRGRARTLAETIVGLIPEECNCRSRTKSKSKSKCLHCCFHEGSEENTISYLLRPDDPLDYQILLNRSFVVIPHNAPPLPPEPLSGRHWSQLKIVRRTIETILAEQPGSSNVICCGYDKFKDLSPNAKLLKTSAWDLALQRVGDRIMSYLLMHASIFLPLPYGKHQQVAGPPINCLITEFLKHISEPEIWTVSVQEGALRKRRRERRDNSSHEKLSFALPSQVQGDKYIDEGLKVTDAKPNSCKRLRLPSWLRKRSKSLSSNDASVQSPFIEGNQPGKSTTSRNRHINLGHASEELEGNQDRPKFNILQENLSLCSCCSVFETSLKVPKDAQISRQSMLYNLESSPSLLPMKHMLNSLKLGSGSANHLVKKIFALSNDNCRAQSMSCSHSEGFKSHRSTCLYHSLLKLLKVLVCRAQRCKYDMLLQKHCPIPSLLQNEYDDASTGCEASTRLPAKRQVCNQLEVNIQHKRPRTSKLSSCTSKMEVDDPQSRLSMCYSSRHQVVSFIWAACRSIVPPDLLGTPSSWRILRRNISRFIKIRRFEKFSLKQCMCKLKMLKFPALSDKQYSYHWNCQLLPCGTRESANGPKQRNDFGIANSNIRHRLFERWIFWFFSHLVVPLVQANFYVTESEHGKQELYFYRKSVWKKLSDQAIVSLKEQSYSTLDDTSIRNILSNRPFGLSKLRFRPKEMGVRALANLRVSSRICKQESGVIDQYLGMQKKARSYPGNDSFGYLNSVNHVLRDVHSVFKELRIEEPENWGASVFDYNDVYRKLCPFVMNVKKGLKAMPTVFIVFSDVKKAFDTVNQDKLLKIVDEILLNDEYIMRKSHEIVCRKRSMWVYEKLRLMDQHCAETKSSDPSLPWNTIVVDQEQCRNIRKEEIYFYLYEHVKHNVLQLDQCFFLQDVGIPQGSVLSSLLCSLYYGHLERNIIFPFLKKECAVDTIHQEIDHETDVAPGGSQNKAFGLPKYTLLRFIDDFLFMSTSRKQAASLFSRLQRGFREYNCYMNKDKFCLNFDMDQAPIYMSKRFIVGDDGISFIRWSGLLINCCTLEVQADYTRYLNNHLSSTLTICWQGRPARQLKAKLCDYMRPKCHPIFYDSNINSPATVRLNVYQAFLLCAMKFHCYVRELSSVCKLQPVSYYQVIERSLKYMHKLIKKRMKTITLCSNCKPILQLPREETIWLGLTAYTRVLNRKQARYKDLICLLRSKLVAQGNIGTCSWLMYAVDDSHSSLIWKVKF